MKKQSLDKKGFLKTDDVLLASNILSLALNLSSLIGILVAIALDKSKAVPYDVVLKTAGVSLGLGGLGVTGAITTDLLERRVEKKKSKTPSEQVIDITDQIKKPDEDGESKEFLEKLSTDNDGSSYQI